MQPRYRVLVFSHFSEERDGVDLLKCLASALSKHNAIPDHVIFTTYHEREDGSTRIGEKYRQLRSPNIELIVHMSDKTLKVPETPFPDLCTIYSSLWKEIHPLAAVSTEPTIQGAIKLADRLSIQQGGMQAFVTGSLHLVGGALNLLRP